MGLDDDGNTIVIDEIHTPHSSLYWRAEDYEPALAEGRSPGAIDKEYVRLWLDVQGYKGQGIPPKLGALVIGQASPESVMRRLRRVCEGSART